ncbi:MAG: nitrilase-related carbon-nitrogen hydrolase [Bacteroidota bacterium]
MTTITPTINPQAPVSKLWIATGIILSGFGWYISNGLNGDWWFLLWLAPVPALLLALRQRPGAAFMAVFAACLIGRLSWFGYLERVMMLVPAIIYTILLPLISALIILLTRWVVLRVNAWYAIFAFPIFITVYEFLMMCLSPDGTATSLAYTQLNCLPIIQVAAITGILGVTFMVTFIPSVIALGWHYSGQKTKQLRTITIGGIIIVSVLFWGTMRISAPADKNMVKVGLAVLDEDLHSTNDHPDFEKQKTVAADYAKQAAALAAKGAKLVIFPERVIATNKQLDDSITGKLSAVAAQNHIFVIAGYTNFKGDKERNSALVINDGGKTVADYNKVHLVVGLERQFTPGKDIGLFKYQDMQAGIAVCKDLDFQQYINRYGAAKAGFVFVPAWDFIVDDWLHCRMALLRAVENGFSEVRAARLGRLTISDYYGRVNYEANCANSKAATLVGDVSMEHIDTFYSRFGDWFGYLILVVGIGFVGVAVRRKF